MDAALQLQVSDARAALAFAADLAECSDPGAFAAQVGALSRLIGAESAFVTACERWAPLSAFEVGDPSVYTSELMAGMVRNWREHPVMAQEVAGGGHGPRRISDFVTSREWRQRSLFNDFYRPLGMDRELSAQLAWGPPGSSCCVILHRGGRDFDRRDLALLEVVVPHLRLARARIRPAEPSAGGSGSSPPELEDRLSLTARQAEVLARLAAGRTNAGIAADLGISANTAARHVEAIYGRLGVRTRVAAARLALAGRADQ